MQQALNSINSTTVQEQFTGVNTLFREANFYGYSGFTASGSPINNKQTVYFGFNSGALPFSVAPGASFTYDLYTVQERESLENLWFMGVALDGLYVVWH